jgi:hypothetical protein
VTLGGSVSRYKRFEKHMQLQNVRTTRKLHRIVSKNTVIFVFLMKSDVKKNTDGVLEYGGVEESA